MATPTFAHLPAAKQERILEAARTEFSRYSLAEAQVARIIKDAQISRGAFYKYFTDLKDAYHTVFQAAMTTVHAPIKHAITSPSELAQFVTAILASPYAAFLRLYFTVNEGVINAHPALTNLAPVEWAATVLAHETVRAVLVTPANQQDLLHRYATAINHLKEDHHVSRT
ncbi:MULTISPECIES: TetR/AcrR family transcriptional regulator [unclassified Ligilactobacillus]|uniref:TetR/AcrR family transcriptional regulator n=1 Tax=unclassified Ligilactobacillus TaxID=2767920 RepID=UPI003851CE64